MMMMLCMAETAALSDDGMGRACRYSFRNWKKMASHRAFAVSQNKNGQQACGSSYAYETRQKAIDRALRECSSVVRHFYHREQLVCRIIQVN
jgi:hypothetical protein